MSKPTLIQSILGLPSQSYSFPKERQYFSGTANMMRAAKAGNNASFQVVAPSSRSDLPSQGTHSYALPEQNLTGPSKASLEPLSRDNDDDDEEEDSDKDIFFTPNSSPRVSTVSTTAMFNGTAALSATSLSSTSHDEHSLFSSPSNPSTRATTPVSSDAGHGSLSSTKMTYTDEDWVNDVHWQKNGESSKTSSSSSFLPRTIPKSRRSKPLPIPSNVPPIRKPPHPSKGMSKTAPSIMMNMTALIEEDEGQESPSFNLSLHQTPRSKVLLPGPMAPKMRSASDGYGRVPHMAASTSTGSSSGSAMPEHGPGRRRHQSEHTRPNLSRRRSRSLEDLPRFMTREAGSPYQAALPSQGTPGYTSLTLPRAPAAANSASIRRPRTLNGSDGKIDLTRSGIAQTTMASVEVVRGLGSQVKTSVSFLPFLGRKRKTSNASSPTARRANDESDSILGFTSYRKPPESLPGESVLVQVWAVAVDAIDARLVGVADQFPIPSARSESPPRRAGLFRTSSSRSRTMSERDVELPQMEVGYVPGRSFVGRVLDCGWDVKEEVVKKGEWVTGLLDIKKCGAMQEFIVVDRHRICKVPHPLRKPSALETSFPPPTNPRRAPGSRSLHSSSRISSRRTVDPPTPSTALTLEELALLPICGVAAYRAVRTMTHAFPQPPPSGSAAIPYSPEPKTHRALVLQGHEGVGAMAVQMLIKKGWTVCVHAPLPAFFDEKGDRKDEQQYMRNIEHRVRTWGGAEVVFDDGAQDDRDRRGAVVRAIERLVEDADVFDAVLDTVGGKDVWEASERLLRGVGHSAAQQSPATEDARSSKSLGRRFGSVRRKTSNPSAVKPMGQFTTLIGDFPERPIPSASDLFKAGLRSMKNSHTEGNSKGQQGGKVAYAWVSVAHDVDWDGEDVRETLAGLVKLAVEDGVKPWLGTGADDETERAVPFERSPKLFVDSGPLRDGRAIVVKVVD